ncbi:YjcQ family protein [Sporosarcina saromensis]|uniref:YjcQ family protein n=1 Tax=Sporosarcina saromensis TaxID=359365 RepID=A0ABU4GDK9_9BACL|nr:YjcQ family protein [Sporosarcina saromensis]MDW0115066.1 YjcQ family protein [Sporosarcina saromensis]
MNKGKLIYSILKEIDKGNEPSFKNYDVTLEQFGEVLEMMASGNLIENAIVQRGGIGNKVIYTHLTHTKVTMGGLQYLEDNSGWAKTYNAIKEIRDWIK